VSGSGSVRTAEEILAEARQLVQPAQRAAVAWLDGPLREVAEYQAGWTEADGTPCNRAGKAIRSTLALVCARAATPVSRPGPPHLSAVGTEEVVDAAVTAGVAVELVHEFSLLHDDVMDADTMRRHRPTAWVVFGISRAVLAGDALLVLATDLLATGSLAHSATSGGPGIPPVKVLMQALVELCRGQSADLAFQDRDRVGLDECLAMAEGKTGALLGAACQLGAIAGGADQAAAQAYRAFGRQLGVAFQLVDDLLGIWGDPTVTGKAAGADLACRKRSLPVVAALVSGAPAGRELAQMYAGHRSLDETAIIHAAELVEAAGGRAWAQAEADRRMRAALRALARADPDPAAAADLQTLAALMTRRNH
jgi:geranylgeranyl diphosphate synthase type I